MPLLLIFLIAFLFLYGGFSLHFLLLVAIALLIVWLAGFFAPPYRGSGWYGGRGRWWG